MAIQEVLGDNVSLPLPFPASLAISRGDLLYWNQATLTVLPASQLPPGAGESADQATFAPLFVGISQDTRLASEADAGAIRTVRVSCVCDADCVAGYTPKLGDMVSVTRNGTGTLVSQMVTNTGVVAASAIGRVIGIPTQAANRQTWGAVAARVRVKLNGRMTDFP